ncbi:Protein arginine N-methyltransferase 1.6 [Tetrabaena socialis]|uniref:type I protein arginine methyltransferase n=1 Tax=Tetrabaena socialis TaxID=47790 RepID=A0A2J8A0I6_9CHLO|nr:Protein arginine N-methyltransferase 1.6 [Tetrabaena socialis]|eukprot:PNH06042.1 Protein arginine N-methyltransferase 1.6 [Tetrabaena socialis]
MFVQKLNPLTGEADWVLVNEPGLGDEDDASADLVATSSYLDMLTDTRRNVAYNAALRRVLPAKSTAARAAVAASSSTSTPAHGLLADAACGVRVLDIGTGTGLLAMMAARTLGCGHAPPVEAVAGAREEAQLASSGTSSAAQKDEGAPSSAPVIACEVFPPMQNLSRKEGGVVIPAAARVYGQLVHCPLMHHMAGLRAAAPPAADIGGAQAVPTSPACSAGAEAPGPSAAARVLGALAELDSQARSAFFNGDESYEVREMHVDALHNADAKQCEAQLKAREDFIRPLSDAFPVFDFDWLRPPPPAGRRALIEVPAVADGSAHAVLLWWQLDMTTVDAGNNSGGNGEPQQPLLLSTAPCWLDGRPEAGGDAGPLEGVAQEWRDHWKQCWVQLANDGQAVRCGDTVSVRFEHDDLNIRAKLASGTQTALGLTPHGGNGAAQAQSGQQQEEPEAPQAATGEAPGGSPPFGGSERSAREVLAALQHEAAEQQQLMPLLSWLGPQALLQLGDVGRLETFNSALAVALADVGSVAAASEGGGHEGACGAEVVVVDGSLALALLSACHPLVESVTLLQEGNVAAGHWLKASATRLGVCGKIKPVRPDAYFKLLAAAKAPSASTKAASAAVSRPPAPLLLVSEPYFSEFEQLVPWAHLRFWRDYDVIRGSAAGAAPSARGSARAAGGATRGRRVATLPQRARLLAVAASLPELWRTRHALGHIEGLNLSAANAVLGVVGKTSAGGAALAELGGATQLSGGEQRARPTDTDDDEGESASGGGGSGGGGGQPLPILPYSVWQAGGGYAELSQRAELLSLDCSGHLGDEEGGVVLTAACESTCHAVVLWMEYDLASGSGQEGLRVSTAPSADGAPGPSVQGVYLLPQPVQLQRGSRLHVAAEFDGLDADVSIDVTVLPPT